VSEKSKGRVEEAIRHLIAEALLRRVKDPRVTGVSITRVDVSSDYSFAKIMYNIVGGSDNLEDVQRGLDSCKGFIRRILRGKLKTRTIPELAFFYDPSLDEAMKIEEIIKRIHEEEATDQVSGEEVVDDSKLESSSEAQDEAEGDEQK